jgi:cytochrome c oxidase subunit IV
MQHTQHQTHHSPNYLGVFIVLAVLTIIELGVTWETAHRIAPFLVPLQIPLLLILALAKAALIVMYYMHLKYDSKVYTATFLLGIFLGLLFTGAVLLR